MKIPSIYFRDPDTHYRRVMRQQNPGCAWVFAGEGVPLRQYDGVCCWHDGHAWWVRRVIKAGMLPPRGYLVTERPASGRLVGWEPMAFSHFSDLHSEALRTLEPPWVEGTYELCAPAVNQNRDRVGRPELFRHADPANRVADVPLDFDALRDFMADFPHKGIVWHHPDGRMAKIRRKDYPKQKERTPQWTSAGR